MSWISLASGVISGVTSLFKTSGSEGGTRMQKYALIALGVAFLGACAVAWIFQSQKGDLRAQIVELQSAIEAQNVLIEAFKANETKLQNSLKSYNKRVETQFAAVQLPKGEAAAQACDSYLDDVLDAYYAN